MVERFIGGDRSIIYGSEEIDQFLKAGVSFATVNYRFKTYFDLGIQGSLCDSARALQFLRSKAVDWNIDKTRVGAYGTSAGARNIPLVSFKRRYGPIVQRWKTRCYRNQRK